MSSRFLALSIVALAVLGGCKTGPTQEEIEAAKNTVDCERPGERIVIRFDEGEARLVMPDGTRVVLYQVPMASGIRYLNGLMELRGKGMNLELIRDQPVPRRLALVLDVLPPTAGTLRGRGAELDQRAALLSPRAICTAPLRDVALDVSRRRR